MLKKVMPIQCLFLDIGEVLLTNGWDHHARRRAAKRFGLAWAEMEDRHKEVFGIFEEGNLTLAEYMDQTVFYRKQSFSRAAFERFMFAQSQPYPDMIRLIKELKAQQRLKVFVVSNEARELNAYRIRKFKLDSVVDAFISSCFVHIRKPDAAIFRLALDIAQVPPAQVAFIDNTAMFVELARGLGMQGIVHTDYASTVAALSELGLKANP